MVESGDAGGVLVIDKPTGPTSHDIVARVRRVLGIRRVGHCGTLDPLATGVLVLCVGPMTRFSRWLTGQDKEYDACFRLGATSDTDDALGRIAVTSPVGPPARRDIEAAMEGFRGSIDQVPPDHSAVRVRGVRSYHRARRRQATGLTARPVRIDRFEVRGYDPPRLRVLVECSKGTYIRSLARDLGQALGCGGLVEQLRRLRVGTLTTRDAVTWPALQGKGLKDGLLDARRALHGVLGFVEVDRGGAEAFSQGRPIPIEARQGERAVFHQAGFLGVGRVDEEGRLRPRRVLTGSGIRPESAEGADDGETTG